MRTVAAGCASSFPKSGNRACCFSWPSATASRCATCARAFRRSKTSSRARSARSLDAMPVHDQGYRHYTGERTLHGRGWWVIARAGLADRLHERRVLGPLLFSWSLFVVRARPLYIGQTLPRGIPFAPSEQNFPPFLEQPRLFVVFLPTS